MYKLFGKRIIDFIGSLIIFFILSPLFLIIYFWLFIINKGKPFFKQKRPGYKEKPFTLIKFKTMNDKRDKAGNLLPDVQRIHKVGLFLRKTSIDEIPQLINVLKGDMSLIGPRPLLFKYLPLYSDEQKRRHEVRPGITGLAQVKGRNSISWSKKFKYDVYYVNNISFRLDMKILLLTVYQVLRRKGINQDNDTTAEHFNGSN